MRCAILIPKRRSLDQGAEVESDNGDRRTKPGLFERLGLTKREAVSEEEIKDMVADAEELREDEKRMIHDIIDLSDMAVHEIMTPRVDMMLVEDTETGRTALERMRGTGHSRLPVYHDDTDGVVGIVYYKDLIGPLMDGRIDEPVTKFMYEPLFVPETKDVIPLLGEMQAARQQMAIVVDEYGGTDGLITMEDIVEEIVGEILDESDPVRDVIVDVAPGVWRVDGRYPIEDALAMGWPVVDSPEYETLAGWLMEAFDSVPSPGDAVTAGAYRFKVERMRRSRISVVRVEESFESQDDEGVCEEG